MKIGHILLNLIDYCKSKKEQRKRREYEYMHDEICREFRLVERDGTYYIICAGIAIESFPKHVSLEQVSGRIKQLRYLATFYALPDYKQPK